MKNNVIGKRLVLILVLTTLILSVIPLFSPSVEATGANYYVATTGNDGAAGTIGAPWRHITHSITHLVSGDTLYIRGGTYYEKTLFNYLTGGFRNQNGTSTSWITVRNYPSETVIMDGKLNTSDSKYTSAFFGFNKSSYIRISGIIMNNSNCFGIYCFDRYNHDIRIDNCTIRNTSTCGLYFLRNSNLSTQYVKNITIDYNTIDWVNNNNNGVTYDNEGVSFSGVKNFTVHHNMFRRGCMESFDFKSGTNNGTVYNNRINATHYVFNLASNCVGIYIDGYWNTCSDITVYNNDVWGSPAGDGTGIQFDAEKSSGKLNNITIYNNKVNMTGAGGDVACIWIGNDPYNTPIKDVKIYSNTFYGKLATPLIAGDESANYVRVTIKNNIFVSNTYYQLSYRKTNFAGGPVTLGNNLYYRTDGTTRTEWLDGDTQFEATSVRANPLFKNKNVGDFHLNYTSPCIDAGTSTLAPTTDYEGNTRPQGKGYDLGAYEWSPNLAFSSISPANISTGNNLIPTCSITITTPKGYLFNYTLRTNDTAHPTTWTTRASAVNQGNGTKTFSYTNVSSYATKYWWRVTTVNKSVWNNATYYFTTTALPVNSLPSPTNGATGTNRNPPLYITVYDADDSIQNMNVTFRTNATGSWATIGTNTSVNNGRYYKQPTTMTSYSHKYWWSVNTSDGHGGWDNDTYYFTTGANDVTVQSSPNPSNGSTGVSIGTTQLTISITDGSSNLFNWSITTSPNIGTSSGLSASNGTKTCSITGLAYNTSYYWTVHSIDTGSLTWINRTYHFTTRGSLPIILSNPSIANNSINIPITTASVSIDMNDPEGDDIYYIISTTPPIGLTMDPGGPNGTKTLVFNTTLAHSTTYTWAVVSIDDGSMIFTNATYSFTTCSPISIGSSSGINPITMACALLLGILGLVYIGVLILKAIKGDEEITMPMIKLTMGETAKLIIGAAIIILIVTLLLSMIII